jgi:hypothetical protein
MKQCLLGVLFNYHSSIHIKLLLLTQLIYVYITHAQHWGGHVSNVAVKCYVFMKHWVQFSFHRPIVLTEGFHALSHPNRATAELIP